jgi:hypothetical protein
LQQVPEVNSSVGPLQLLGDRQVIGTAEYAPNPWLTFDSVIAASILTIRRATEIWGFNIHMRGPILAGTFRF